MSGKKVEFITAEQAALLIDDESMIAVGGFIGTGVAEEVHKAIERRFFDTNHPNDLGLIYAGGIGDRATRGLNHYGHEGLVKRIIGGHWGLVPTFQPLVEKNLVEGYNFPQGVMSQIFRDAAAKRNWHLSKIGLGTFVDPEIDGGKLNAVTTEELIKKVEIENEEFLAYKTIYPDVAILKGTYADENGNISFEDEPLILEAISMAMATSNNGGKVIVQVKEERPVGTLDPKSIMVPGVCVDYVVVAKDITDHQQTFDTVFNEKFITAGVIERDENAGLYPLTAKKIIARRAAMFLNPEIDHVVNYGIGVPEVVAQVLSEENQESHFTPTVEPGIFGGTPQGGLDFGCCVYPEAIIQQGDMFQFYNGGGLDAAFLGMAETDKDGNVNVSKFGPKIAGAGGFIDITQTAKKVIFTGTFTAKGVKYDIDSEGLRIEQEGSKQKLVEQVEHITFSGAFAKKHHQEVYYVTERAVFKLEAEGLTLIEIAPGIDLEKDILAHMAFKPLIAETLTLMDLSIFSEDTMDLKF